MQMVVVAVYDAAVEAYNRPFFAPSVGAAMRSFADEVNRPAADNVLHQHPDDFTMMHLSNFDETSGLFEAVEIRALARGKDVKNEQ